MKLEYIEENSTALIDKTTESSITNEETLEAFHEADMLKQHGGRRYNTFDELLKDVLHSE